MYQIEIKKTDNFYYFKFEDCVEGVCALVDCADSDEFNLNWSDIIEIIFNLKSNVNNKIWKYECI